MSESPTALSLAGPVTRLARCLRPWAQVATLRAACRRETTAAFGTSPGARTGIEGTLARGIRRRRLRRTRYRGRPKVRLGHIRTATGRNSLRRFAGTPRYRHRCSPFVRLLAEPTAA